MGKVTLYIATSLDGFIADQDGGVDWLPHYEDPEDIVGYKALMNRIQIIIMGSRSYAQIIGFGEWAWSDKKTYVFSNQKLSSLHSSISFVQGNPKTLIDQLLFGDIWLLGGAQLIKSFAAAQLIDESIITVVPVKLEKGIALELPYDDFTLISEKTCMDSIVQKTYKRTLTI